MVTCRTVFVPSRIRSPACKQTRPSEERSEVLFIRDEYSLNAMVWRVKPVAIGRIGVTLADVPFFIG